MQYWLLKSEPFKYSYDDLVRDKRTYWDGVRNYQARHNLRAMKKGDKALYYHSNEGKEVIGVVTIVKEAYPDPTAKEGDWSVVDVAPDKKLKRTVTLAEIKQTASLQEMALIKQSRLSVMPVTAKDFKEIIKIGNS